MNIWLVFFICFMIACSASIFAYLFVELENIQKNNNTEDIEKKRIEINDKIEEIKKLFVDPEVVEKLENSQKNVNTIYNDLITKKNELFANVGIMTDSFATTPDVSTPIGKLNKYTDDINNIKNFNMSPYIDQLNKKYGDFNNGVQETNNFGQLVMKPGLNNYISDGNYVMLNAIYHDKNTQIDITDKRNIVKDVLVNYSKILMLDVYKSKCSNDTTITTDKDEHDPKSSGMCKYVSPASSNGTNYEIKNNLLTSGTTYSADNFIEDHKP